MPASRLGFDFAKHARQRVVAKTENVWLGVRGKDGWWWCISLTLTRAGWRRPSAWQVGGLERRA
jgi:hypothetical protein